MSVLFYCKNKRMFDPYRVSTPIGSFEILLKITKAAQSGFKSQQKTLWRLFSLANKNNPRRVVFVFCAG